MSVITAEKKHQEKNRDPFEILRSIMYYYFIIKIR